MHALALPVYLLGDGNAYSTNRPYFDSIAQSSSSILCGELRNLVLWDYPTWGICLIREITDSTAAGQYQRIATGDDDVSHFRMILAVIKHPVDLDISMYPSAVLPFALAGAMATEHGAKIGQHHEYAVGISVHQSWNYRVFALFERILNAGGIAGNLAETRDGLCAYRVRRVGRID